MGSYYYAIVEGDFDLEKTTDRLNEELLRPLVRRYNHEYAPDVLARLGDESFIGDPRKKSAIRARVGLLIEYAFIDILREMVEEDTNGEQRVTFNTTNQFADFFIRDPLWEIDLRIDVKAFEDESAEASPRFDLPISQVDRKRDYLLIARWGWSEVKRRGVTLVIPEVQDATIVSGYEMALERDRRQLLAGGSFDSEGSALAASGKPDTNFGKLNRIIHESRLDAADLDPFVKKMSEIIF